jgi:hypothetical protein
MSVGPLRRLIGTLGLVALAPTAALLALGTVTPVDAAIRAVVTLVSTLLVGRVATWWLNATAASFEQVPAEGDAERPAPAPRRRRTDAPE